MIVCAGLTAWLHRDPPVPLQIPAISTVLLLVVFCTGAFAARDSGPLRQRPSTTTAQVPSTATASMFTIEGEELVKEGRVQANSGKVVAQPMSSFGQGWSQNAQLFWTGGAIGATLDLTIEVPVAATYAVEVYMTRAPDYADFIMQVDGKPSNLKFSGFTPTVMAPNPMQAGKFPLQAGTRRISLLITGKYPQGTGYLVGIDRIVFYPSGPIATTQQAESGVQPAGPTVDAETVPGALGSLTTLEVWDGLARPDKIRLYQKEVFIDRNRKDFQWWFRWSTSVAGATGAVWQVLWEPAQPTMEGWKSPAGLADRGLIPDGVPQAGTFRDFDLNVKPWVWAPVKAGQTAPPVLKDPQLSKDPALKPKDMARGGHAKPGSRSSRGSAAAQGTSSGATPGGTFYVRVVPLSANGDAAGPPSQTVKIVYGEPEKEGTLDVTLTSAGLGFPAAKFTGFASGHASVWMSWCYQVATKDFQMIKKGQARNACQSSGGGLDLAELGETFLKLGEMSIDYVADVYNGAKGTIVSAVASVLKDTVGCGAWCEKALQAGLTIAMTSVGLPPSMPDFDQLVANGKDYLASQVAAELAKNSPVPLTQELAKKAAEAAIEEFAGAAKSRASGSGAPLWIPDPAKQYQPLVLMVRVKGQSQPLSSPATVVLSQAGGDHYKTRSIALPSLKKDQHMTIPMVMAPSFPPDAWAKVYPFGNPADKCSPPKSISDNPGALPPPAGSPEAAKQEAAQKAYQECQHKAWAEHNAKINLAHDLFNKWTTKYAQGAVTFRVDVKNSGGQEWAMDKVMCATPLGSCQVPKP